MVRLLDPYGRPIPKAMFEAVNQARRLKSWIPSDLHINALLQYGAETLRNRSRQMVRDNGYAANGADSFCANLIGTGIKPSVITEEGSGISEETKKEIQWLWFDWVDEADADGINNFYGMQAVVAKEIFEAGEAFIRFRPRRFSDGLAVPLQLQLLEAEQLPIEDQSFTGTGNPIRCGIEFDAIGRRSAYHFYKRHPGDATEMNEVGEKTRVPASEVLHIYPASRAGQIRGLPRMVASIVKMFILDQYDDAELDRKKVAALFAGFVTSPEENSPLMGETQEGEAYLEPGTMQKLLPGEDVRFSSPAEVGGSYESFQYRTLLQIACGLGMPYSSVSGDLRQTSYSSIRAGLIEFQRRMRQLLFNVIVHQMCRPVWQRFVEIAVLSKALEKAGLADIRKLQRRVKWIPPKWEWVDPYKEIMAIRASIRAGVISRDFAIEQLGLEPDEVDESAAAGNRRADKLKLAFDSDPRRVSNAGVGQDGRSLLPKEKEEEVDQDGGDQEEENGDGTDEGNNDE
mgnify:CR=1 FL=1